MPDDFEFKWVEIQPSKRDALYADMYKRYMRAATRRYCRIPQILLSKSLSLSPSLGRVEIKRSVGDEWIEPSTDYEQY